MKKPICLLLVLLLFSFFSFNAFAHPGGTDASGGHYVGGTGEYHYHHGFSAHQHSDIDGDGIRDCPYEFVDRTGDSPAESNVESNRESADFPPVFLIIILSAAFLWAVVLVMDKIQTHERERLKQEADERREREKWLAEKEKYTNLYAGKSLLEVVNAPPNCYVTLDGLPASYIGSGKWGDGYTVYTTFDGNAFHTRHCRYASVYGQTNIYIALHPLQSYRTELPKRPCSVCNPDQPDLSWFYEYQRVKAIKEKYGID